MEIVFTILGVLVCLILLIILILYVTFAYKMYQYNKKSKEFFAKHELNNKNKDGNRL